jgi:TonB family protein
MSMKPRYGMVAWLWLALAAAVAAEKPADITVDMALPLVLSWVPPVYPKAAADKKLEGWVQVRFIVDETGAVTKARPVRSSDKIFEDAAVQSVLQWRFEPAMDGGRKVAKCMDVVLPFQLKDLNRNDTPSFPPARVSQSLTYSPSTKAVKVAGDDPEYPESLLPRHLPGQVLVEFSVDTAGQVQGLKILAATHTDFIRPALAAAGKWTFLPATQGDLAVPASMQASLEFTVFEPKQVDVLAANGVSLAKEQAVDMATLDQRPVLLLVADPVYPYDLLLAGTEGAAEADFVIGADGSVQSVSVRQATQPEFGRALAAALECWLFKPARNASSGVPIKAVLHWHFGPPATSGASWPVTRLVERIRNKDTANLTAKGLDARPEPWFQAAPLYPAELRGADPAGKAEIEFILDREGRCRLARIVAASREEFGWAAATAVERWVFNPPKRGGQPVDMRVRIPVEFKAPQ